MKYIFVTGGVVSGLGKGITAASVGRLLINRGLRVTVQKLDPYLNVDPGNMNPYRHGEVFVTGDGHETDLDIGHYERFLGINCSKQSSFTMGKVYSQILAKERNGEYMGRDVQVVPHVTDEIKRMMRSLDNSNDVAIVEIGGTVGEIESMTCIEAVRQLIRELGPQGACSIHVTLVPYLEASGEIKTKPTQNSFRDLAQMGVYPNLIVCRTNAGVEWDADAKEKIAMFCNLKSTDHVIHNVDAKSIYQVPLLLKEQRIDDLVLECLGLDAPKGDMKDWAKMVEAMLAPVNGTTVAVVGKYVAVADSYISIIEAIKAAAYANKIVVKIKLVDSEEIEKQGVKLLKGIDAVVVPSDSGDRGIEGTIATIKYARENKIPFLGVNFGMQMAVVEFARTVLGLKDAHSTEIATNTTAPVIVDGETMRLGLYDCTIKNGTVASGVYKNTDGFPTVKERHRNRYEVNNIYRDALVNAGLVISGENKEFGLIEIIELNDHPYFVASQFHPELLSRPYSAHPLFIGLVRAIKKEKK